MKRILTSIILLTALQACDSSSVYKPPTTGQSSATYPAATGFVVDQAHKLSGTTINQLQQKAASLAKNGGPEIAVVTVPNMGGESVEAYSMHLAEKWRIGKKGVDNGVILLVAMAERKIRIEVGTGLEPKLTDSKAKRIIDEVVSPPLHRGDFDGGMIAGFEAIAKQIK